MFPPLTQQLVPHARSVSVARHTAVVELELLGVDDDQKLEDAELLVSELVTNAVQAATSYRPHDPPQEGVRYIDFRLECSADAVRIAVTDYAPWKPQVVKSGPLATSGRGHEIVELLTGTRPTVFVRGDSVTVEAVLPLAA
jgi:hypothetical protein